MNATRQPNPESHFRVHASHFAGPFQITIKCYSPSFSQGWHEHDRGSIDLVLAGGGTGMYGGREIVSPGGQVEYFASGVRHNFRCGPRGIRTAHIAFPGWVHREAGVDPDLIASALPHAGAIGPAVCVLEEVLSTHSPDLLLLESLAMRILEDLAGPVRRSAGRSRWIEEVREILEEEPELATSLADIAAVVGRHPSHVSREFRASFGMSVGEFGRRVRLSRSAIALASGRVRSIAQVAIEHGFCDQAHYANAFRRHVGCTPNEFMRRVGRMPDSVSA